MSKLNIPKLIEYWKLGSEKDFHSASEIAGKTKEYVNALFLTHLSIEKILKAHYVQKFKEHAPFTHNLIQLASKLELEIDDVGMLAQINEYNLRCRYPDDSYQIYKKATKAKAEKSLEYALEFRKWIIKKLK